MPTQGYLGAFYSRVFTKLVEDCEDAWEESDPVTGVTVSVDSGDYKEGSASAKFVMTVDAAIGILASEVVALDLTKHRRITLWIKSSISTSSGNLQLLLDNNADCASPEESIDIPALSAGVWTAVTLTLVTPANLGSVISIGISQVIDLGIFDLWIDAVKGISSLVISTMESTNPATGDGTNKEFQIANANIDLDTLVVEVNSVVVKDYDVTVKGKITFVTAPGAGLTVKATYTYWVMEAKGGFHNWSFSLAGDTAEKTDFTSTGWKSFVGILKGWTGTAEQFWQDEKWTDEMNNLLIIKLYANEGTTLRYEGWGLLSGIDVSAAVDTLITSPISFQGHGVLNYETA